MKCFASGMENVKLHRFIRFGQVTKRGTANKGSFNSFLTEVSIIQKPVRANQWTGFSLRTAIDRKKLNHWFSSKAPNVAYSNLF